MTEKFQILRCAESNLGDSLELNQYWLDCQNFCNMNKIS